MRLIRFLMGALAATASTYFYGGWAQAESETQIGKMLLNAYNTPGAETPLTPQVIAAGFTVLGAVWSVQRKVLRLGRLGALVALLLGVAGGVAALVLPARTNNS